MIFQFIYFAFLHEVLNKISPNVGESIPEPGEFLLVESGIRDPWLWNPEYNSRNPESH